MFEQGKKAEGFFHQRKGFELTQDELKCINHTPCQQPHSDARPYVPVMPAAQAPSLARPRPPDSNLTPIQPYVPMQTNLEQVLKTSLKQLKAIHKVQVEAQENGKRIKEQTWGEIKYNAWNTYLKDGVGGRCDSPAVLTKRTKSLLLGLPPVQPLAQVETVPILDFLASARAADAQPDPLLHPPAPQHTISVPKPIQTLGPAIPQPRVLQPSQAPAPQPVQHAQVTPQKPYEQPVAQTEAPQQVIRQPDQLELAPAQEPSVLAPQHTPTPPPVRTPQQAPTPTPTPQVLLDPPQSKDEFELRPPSAPARRILKVKMLPGKSVSLKHTTVALPAFPKPAPQAEDSAPRPIEPKIEDWPSRTSEIGAEHETLRPTEPRPPAPPDVHVEEPIRYRTTEPQYDPTHPQQPAPVVPRYNVEKKLRENLARAVKLLETIQKVGPKIQSQIETLSHAPKAFQAGHEYVPRKVWTDGPNALDSIRELERNARELKLAAANKPIVQPRPLGVPRLPAAPCAIPSLPPLIPTEPASHLLDPTTPSVPPSPHPDECPSQRQEPLSPRQDECPSHRQDEPPSQRQDELPSPRQDQPPTHPQPPPTAQGKGRMRSRSLKAYNGPPVPNAAKTCFLSGDEAPFEVPEQMPEEVPHAVPEEKDEKKGKKKYSAEELEEYKRNCYNAYKNRYVQTYQELLHRLRKDTRRDRGVVERMNGIGDTQVPQPPPDYAQRIRTSASCEGIFDWPVHESYTVDPEVKAYLASLLDRSLKRYQEPFKAIDVRQSVAPVSCFPSHHALDLLYREQYCTMTEEYAHLLVRQLVLAQLLFNLRHRTDNKALLLHFLSATKPVGQKSIVLLELYQTDPVKALEMCLESDQCAFYMPDEERMTDYLCEAHEAKHYDMVCMLCSAFCPPNYVDVYGSYLKNRGISPLHASYMSLLNAFYPTGREQNTVGHYKRVPAYNPIVPRELAAGTHKPDPQCDYQAAFAALLDRALLSGSRDFAKGALGLWKPYQVAAFSVGQAPFAGRAWVGMVSGVVEFTRECTDVVFEEWKLYAAATRPYHDGYVGRRKSRTPKSLIVACSILCCMDLQAAESLRLVVALLFQELVSLWKRRLCPVNPSCLSRCVRIFIRGSYDLATYEAFQLFFAGHNDPVTDITRNEVWHGVYELLATRKTQEQPYSACWETADASVVLELLELEHLYTYHADAWYESGFGANPYEISLRDIVRRKKPYALFPTRECTNTCRIVVPGDGNCFYHCLTRAYGLKEQAAATMRAVAVKAYLQLLSCDPFYSSIVNQTEAELQAVNYTYATDPFIEAVGIFLRINIKIFKEDNTFTIMGLKDDRYPTLYLCFSGRPDGGHFNVYKVPNGELFAAGLPPSLGSVGTPANKWVTPPQLLYEPLKPKSAPLNVARYFYTHPVLESGTEFRDWVAHDDAPPSALVSALPASLTFQTGHRYLLNDYTVYRSKLRNSQDRDPGHNRASDPEDVEEPDEPYPDELQTDLPTYDEYISQYYCAPPDLETRYESESQESSEGEGESENVPSPEAPEEEPRVGEGSTEDAPARTSEPVPAHPSCEHPSLAPEDGLELDRTKSHPPIPPRSEATRLTTRESKVLEGLGLEERENVGRALRDLTRQGALDQDENYEDELPLEGARSDKRLEFERSRHHLLPLSSVGVLSGAPRLTKGEHYHAPNDLSSSWNEEEQTRGLSLSYREDGNPPPLEATAFLRSSTVPLLPRYGDPRAPASAALEILLPFDDSKHKEMHYGAMYLCSILEGDLADRFLNCEGAPFDRAALSSSLVARRAMTGLFADHIGLPDTLSKYVFYNDLKTFCRLHELRYSTALRVTHHPRLRFIRALLFKSLQVEHGITIDVLGLRDRSAGPGKAKLHACASLSVPQTSRMQTAHYLQERICGMDVQAQLRLPLTDVPVEQQGLPPATVAAYQGFELCANNHYLAGEVLLQHLIARDCSMIEHTIARFGFSVIPFAFLPLYGRLNRTDALMLPVLSAAWSLLSDLTGLENEYMKAAIDSMDLCMFHGAMLDLCALCELRAVTITPTYEMCHVVARCLNSFNPLHEAVLPDYCLTERSVRFEPNETTVSCLSLAATCVPHLYRNAKSKKAEQHRAWNCKAKESDDQRFFEHYREMVDRLPVRISSRAIAQYVRDAERVTSAASNEALKTIKEKLAEKYGESYGQYVAVGISLLTDVVGIYPTYYDLMAIFHSYEELAKFRLVVAQYWQDVQLHAGVDRGPLLRERETIAGVLDSEVEQLLHYPADSHNERLADAVRKLRFDLKSKDEQLMMALRDNGSRHRSRLGFYPNYENEACLKCSELEYSNRTLTDNNAALSSIFASIKDQQARGLPIDLTSGALDAVEIPGVVTSANTTLLNKTSEAFTTLLTVVHKVVPKIKTMMHQSERYQEDKELQAFVNFRAHDGDLNAIVLDKISDFTKIMSENSSLKKEIGRLRDEVLKMQLEYESCVSVGAYGEYGTHELSREMDKTLEAVTEPILTLTPAEALPLILDKMHELYTYELKHWTRLFGQGLEINEALKEHLLTNRLGDMDIFVCSDVVLTMLITLFSTQTQDVTLNSRDYTKNLLIQLKDILQTEAQNYKHIAVQHNAIQREMGMVNTLREQNAVALEELKRYRGFVNQAISVNDMTPDAFRKAMRALLVSSRLVPLKR